MKPIRVLLADDHGLVRSGIRVLLEDMEGIEVIGEAGEGWEVLRLIEAKPPDVVLMDISMPGLNGLAVTARVAKEFPHTRVLILSIHVSEEYVLRALRAGASGYLVKDASVSELELAIRAVDRGQTYLSPSVSRPVVADYMQLASADAAPVDPLTPRQREILQLIAEGHSTKEIASKLDVSVKTAETHRAQLMERLAIHDVAGLVRYAIRIGLVTPEP